MLRAEPCTSVVYEQLGRTVRGISRLVPISSGSRNRRHAFVCTRAWMIWRTCAAAVVVHTHISSSLRLGEPHTSDCFSRVVLSYACHGRARLAWLGRVNSCRNAPINVEGFVPSFPWKSFRKAKGGGET